MPRGRLLDLGSNLSPSLVGAEFAASSAVAGGHLLFLLDLLWLFIIWSMV